jgi:superfamily I DNA/RNA helicase
VKRTEEQEAIIEAVEEGHNVFVDACIGAGKTTTLNDICITLKNKKILYLTYNKLLKEDAKKQIRSRNVEVHNYHGFVYRYLMAYRIPYTHQNGIKDFIKNVENGTIHMPQYDVMLVDEYQDINNDAAKLIKTIDEYQRKDIQLVFVGDMKQKIYDTTTINVLEDCIFSLRDNYKQMDLTNCFRLNENHAKMLGNIWKKNIRGVNPNQLVQIIDFDMEDLYEKINEYENKDILILSPFRNNVALNKFINHIEKENPVKYNKKNLYITISDTENSNKPLDNSMIVTTFDGSKGLERKLAIVFGFETDALAYRSEKSDKDIIKNLFLVAASRGKDEILFIKENQMLTEKNFELFLLNRKLDEEYSPSKMFDFCFDTDIQKAFETLETKEIETKNKSEIRVVINDYNITLAPVIGIYQEAIFFKDWDYEKI